MNRASFLKLFLGLSLLTVIVFRFLVIPEQNRRESFVERQSEAKLEFMKAEQSRKLYEQRLKDAELFRDKLPVREDMAILARDLTALADRNNISWERITFKPFSMVAEGIYELGFTLPVSGEYQSLRRFISEVEKVRTLITIEAISNLSIGENERLKMDFRMITYFRSSGEAE